MADTLTKQQLQAVEYRGGELLISAAAGSGKTKVLVERLIRYLTDANGSANIDEFLMITYTKAAASELRGKIASALTQILAEQPENRHLQRQMQRLYMTKISTVHGFCAELLREYAYRLDLPADFRVADEQECSALRARVMEQVLDEAYRSIANDTPFQFLVNTQGLGRKDDSLADIIFQVYDSALCHLDPKRWLAQCLQNAEVGAFADAAQTIWGAYLMDDLFACLDRQIGAMRRCVQIASSTDGWDKPARVLSVTLADLERLRACENWDAIVANRSIDYGRLVFPKKSGDAQDAVRIKAVRTACKNELAKKLAAFADTSAVVLEDLGSTAVATRAIISLTGKFSEAFSRQKARRRILDFGDLEQKTLDLLLGKSRTSRTLAADEIGARFREIMVDEYQDSNAVQDAIFSALTAKRRNLFMVGDVKQSIYQFRLADPDIFLGKYNAYSLVDDKAQTEGKKVLLSSNFRSGAAILSAANDVFSRCMSQSVGGLAYTEAESLREGVPHMPLGEPEVELYAVAVRDDTYAEEAALIARRISQLLDGTHMVRCADGLRPIHAEDIVILLRSPGSVGQEYCAALQQYGIPCNMGADKDLLSTAEVSALRSLLQVVSNPRQDIPLIAALTSPVFAFTSDELAAIRANCRGGCFYEALCADTSPKCTAFCSVLAQLRMEAKLCSPADLIRRIFATTHIDGIFSAMEDGERRVKNLQSFYRLAVRSQSGVRMDLEQFLQRLESAEQSGSLPVDAQGEANAVTIMSIHKSKGLEFPVVFLAGLSRRFNRESAYGQVLCDKVLGLGLSCVDEQNRVRYSAISKRAIALKLIRDGLSEEMRVLYVAMTRARDRLIMTYASDTLESDMTDLCARMDFGDDTLVTGSVSCAGEWVLMEALHRTEADALRNLSECSAASRVSTFPWHVGVYEAPETGSRMQPRHANTRQLDAQTVQTLQDALSFTYPYIAATQTPSKLTATQIKGRQKDREAAENAASGEQHKRTWRKAAFSAAKERGKDYGSAMHAALQYLRFENCTDEKAVADELARLVEQRYLTPEQGELVNCKKLSRFFASELGARIRAGENVLREFKFSILEDASKFQPGLQGERVLLQGVVDCALIEPDGITVVDFKTDHVTDETLPDVAARYSAQVNTYADALARIYGKAIKGSFLYFFALDRFAQVTK